MPKHASSRRLGLDHARAVWLRRQGLSRPVPGSLSEVVRVTGWPRTLGGVDAYLAIRARVPDLDPSDLDAAVTGGELRVVPAVRSCIYLVPRDEVPLVLRLAETQWTPRTERDLVRAGSSWGEVAEVAEAALAALEQAPATTDALRRKLSAGLVRSLGDRGKRVGLSSPLPVALRRLELDGRLERVPATGRLDTERYVWQVPKRSPLAESNLTSDPAALLERLAARFFAVAAPATTAHFAAWAGVGQRVARAAVQALGLARVVVDGFAEEAWALPEDLEPPCPPEGIHLLPFEDNLLALHGGPAALTDAAHHSRPTPVWGSTRGSTLGDARHASARTVVADGRIVGFWEYDPDSGTVVTGIFAPIPDRKVLAASAREMTTLLRDRLGHGRSFSLDTDRALRERAELVRALELESAGAED